MRSDFSSSRLVRMLAGWTPVEADADADVAERLSLWLNAFDAIGLQAAQQSIRAIRTTTAGKAVEPRPPRAQALAEDVERTRAALAAAIAQDPLARAGQAPAPSALRRLRREGGAPAQVPAASADVDAEVTYAPFQQRHAELQRQMDKMLRPLRDHVRQALGRASPRLRQLAALDAVMEQVLAAREEAVLPTVGVLLERRFDALRRAARAAAADDNAPPDDAAGWLDAFRHAWRQALLAEVDLRLEPVLGLVEALDNETTDRR